MEYVFVIGATMAVMYTVTSNMVDSISRHPVKAGALLGLSVLFVILVISLPSMGGLVHDAVCR